MVITEYIKAPITKINKMLVLTKKAIYLIKKSKRFFDRINKYFYNEIT